LIAELAGATDLLISSPLHNLGMPSSLKAWLDHVVRVGHTIERGPEGYRGRLAGRRAYVVTACGGLPGEDDDFLVPHLRAALRLLGWAEVEVVRLVGTALAEPERTRHAQLAAAELARLFADASAPRGADHAMLADLRRGQAAAILARDAEAYAALCTDDVCLLLPGIDLVQGRAALLERERELLRDCSIVRFDKTPERVIVEGDTAIEVGRQVVELADAGAATGVFARTQKYTHVLRRGPNGWRFAVLMSNACE
jgi:FMN-dependent NADH-azoreductase